MVSPQGGAAPSPLAWPHARLAGAELLERAVGYTRTSLQLVAGTDLRAATPCDAWDLLRLLHHMNDSLAAFTDAADIGYVDLVPVHDSARGPDPARLLVSRLKDRACSLLAAWAQHPGTGDVTVADRRLRSDLLAATGALEIAAHGWDVAAACGLLRPLPAPLALELLDVVPLVVGADDRPTRFAERVDVPLHARPSTRLLASLGRRASWPD